ncbi:MAG: ABC transporter ATP-binding protein [Longibaculum sp.]
MLKLTNVKKHYDRFTLNCSLNVKPGCVTGLIGQNGAGKSTTFKAILDLISIDDGKIQIFDSQSQHLSQKDKQKIGVVLSDSGFSEYLSIKDIIPVLDALYDQFEKQQFIQRCQDFSLPMNKKIKDFSTGMKAKLKVLIALSHHAKLLILDEPTAGLDVIARDELLDILRDYLAEDESCSILMSSHISSDLEGLCDDLYMIHDGQIILHEETDILLSDYAIIKVDENQYQQLDHQYILKYQKENYGYSCLTNQKQYFLENYPSFVIEKSCIDDVITMMIRGERA